MARAGRGRGFSKTGAPGRTKRQEDGGKQEGRNVISIAWLLALVVAVLDQFNAVDGGGGVRTKTAFGSQDIYSSIGKATL